MEINKKINLIKKIPNTLKKEKKDGKNVGVKQKVKNSGAHQKILCVKDNDRFPEDFMFQLSEKEKAEVVAICDLKVSH